MEQTVSSPNLNPSAVVDVSATLSHSQPSSLFNKEDNSGGGSAMDRTHSSSGCPLSSTASLSSASQSTSQSQNIVRRIGHATYVHIKQTTQRCTSNNPGYTQLSAVDSPQGSLSESSSLPQIDITPSIPSQEDSYLNGTESEETRKRASEIRRKESLKVVKQRGK